MPSTHGWLFYFVLCDSYTSFIVRLFLYCFVLSSWQLYLFNILEWDNNHVTKIMKKISLQIHLFPASIPVLFTERDAIFNKVLQETPWVLSPRFMYNWSMKIEMIYTFQCLWHYLAILLKIQNVNTIFISKIKVSYGKNIYMLILHIYQSILSVPCKYNTPFYFGKY